MKNILLTPFQKFSDSESLGGILLFVATIVALIWANTPYQEYYHGLLYQDFGFTFHDFHLIKPLILWINDGLMAIFFFLIGLELKRELLIGEINTVKKATFPLVAALGGIILPIILFLVLNQDPATANGWGIPMATDIAFALAILTTLGSRIPLALKIFLTAFAIIDDIAAVLVIAIFYSTNINWLYILYAVLIVLFLAVLYKKTKFSFTIGTVLAVIVWFLFLKSGIHPTIAGVLLAFAIPIKKNINIKTFSIHLRTISTKLLRITDEDENYLLTDDERLCIDHLDDITSQVRSPLQELEESLHSFVAYFILPVFAFANAGVEISLNSEFNTSLLIHIAISLFLGKLIGVLLFSYLGVKLNITALPDGIQFKQIIGIASIAGVGFTMSIFIANLAFVDDLVNIDSVKVGVIIGSLISGIVGYCILRFTSDNNEDQLVDNT